jgi:hypothetical protein
VTACVRACVQDRERERERESRTRRAGPKITVMMHSKIKTLQAGNTCSAADHVIVYCQIHVSFCHMGTFSLMHT